MAIKDQTIILFALSLFFAVLIVSGCKKEQPVIVIDDQGNFVVPEETSQ